MKAYISAIAKNEQQYIKEFVQHHLKLGFDKIIIYDNNQPNGEHYDELLASEISSNKVEIVDVRGKSGYQNKSYQESYTKYKNETGWMFFIDIDEFICIEHESDIHNFLSRECFTTFNQIYFNWLTMSDNDLVHNDNRPLVTRFTQPIDNGTEPHGCTMNRHVKCAVRLGCVPNINISSPHYAGNVFPSCDPCGNPLQNGPFNYSPDYSEAYIKHFHYKTIEEFIKNKMTKGFADYQRKTSEPFQDFFEKNKMTIDKTKWMIDYIFTLQQNKK